jgi:hypothetical protein
MHATDPALTWLRTILRQETAQIAAADLERAGR